MPADIKKTEVITQKTLISNPYFEQVPTLIQKIETEVKSFVQEVELFLNRRIQDF